MEPRKFSCCEIPAPLSQEEEDDDQAQEEEDDDQAQDHSDDDQAQDQSDDDPAQVAPDVPLTQSTNGTGTNGN